MADKADNPTNDSFSFVEAENRILEFWQRDKIFQKSLQQTCNCPPYVFYDGPPFATGLPHHGHLVGSILKDAVPRYFTMKGYYVQRRFGWDCHGLPIEHEIDKQLGMSSQEAVAKIGIKGYNDECRAIVQRYTTEWQKTINRIGRWVDFENDYKTMEPWYMESVWWVVKQLWDKGLIYQGLKVVPFSTALSTVLSNFEAGQNYQDVQDPAITVMFKLKDDDTYIAAWTTTPWTLPANLALCVRDDIEYVTVRDEDQDFKFILARERLDDIGRHKNLTVLSAMKGSDLTGRHYQPLFPYFRHLQQQGAFQILSDDYVTTASGTGIVHQAPAFGEDDFRIFKEAGIDLLVCPIDMQGRFTSEVTDFAGQYVKDADKEIIGYLKQSGALYIHDVVVHSYPFCWRSDTPIIYRAIPSWYVRVESMRQQLGKVNQQINWVPDHMRDGRMGKWLEGALDWAISRNRYWGTPLPIWINDVTDKRICIGSIEELKRYSGVEVDDLHRENIDPLSFEVAGEQGTYHRVEEVLDCWFESGAMPYAQVHYPFENQDLFAEGFPAQFIAEGLDQTRGWFYTLIVLGSALFGKPAFSNVIVNGTVLDKEGKKMSKRLRNYTPPDELMEIYGADALRLYLINSSLVRAEDQQFTDAGVKDMVRRALLPWLNAFNFLKTYAEIDGWSPQEHEVVSDNIVDQWIISRLQSLKSDIAREMESYKLYNVVPALFKFIEDLTNWYIRLNRSRFWTEQMTDDKRTAYATLYLCIYELSVSMAPFAPFLSEHIYLELRKLVKQGPKEKESVHLCAYPEAETALIKPELELAVDRMQNIILLGRQKRNQVKIKTKVPLSRLTIIHKDNDLLVEIAKLEQYIKTELNIKRIEYSTEEERFISLYAKPNSPILGKKLGKSFRQYKDLIEQLDAAELNRLQEEGQIELAGKSFTTDEILLFREAKKGTEALSNRFICIDMDCELSEELIAEGWAREVVNRIQRSRRDLGFNIVDRINVVYSSSNELATAIEKHLAYIKTETLANKFVRGNVRDSALQFKIDKRSLSLDLQQENIS